MLVGGAQRGNRRLAGVDQFAFAILRLSERLGPQLAEPEGRAPQAIGVRECNLDRLAAAGPDEPVQQRRFQRDVFVEVLLPTQRRHIGGALADARDVQPGQSRRNEPHGGENTEAPTHVFGNVEGDEIVRRGELLQVTVAFAGHGDDARGRFLCS